MVLLKNIYKIKIICLRYTKTNNRRKNKENNTQLFKFNPKSAYFDGRCMAGVKVNLHLQSIVSPAPKFHLTVLFIKRKPCDVNGTRRLEHAWWNIGAETSTGYYYVSWEGGVKSFTSTEQL